MDFTVKRTFTVMWKKNAQKSIVTAEKRQKPP